MYVCECECVCESGRLGLYLDVVQFRCAAGGARSGQPAVRACARGRLVLDAFVTSSSVHCDTLGSIGDRFIGSSSLASHTLERLDSVRRAACVGARCPVSGGQWPPAARAVCAYVRHLLYLDSPHLPRASARSLRPAPASENRPDSVIAVFLSGWLR